MLVASPLEFGSPEKKGWFIVVALQQVTLGQLSLWAQRSERERARPSWGGRPRAQGGSNMERLEMVKYTQTDKMEEVNPHNPTFK